MTSKPGFRIGPAVMVTAAFIGPGTVMAASRAGADFGFVLLWTVIFAVATAIVLQEMAARLGIVGKRGLAAAIRHSISNVFIRVAAVGLIMSAILFGNAAYQTGNLMGATVGMQILTGQPPELWICAIALLAAAVVAIGRFNLLQWVLTCLVAVMGLIFIAAAVLCRPTWQQIASGFTFNIPDESGWVIIGLIGTTVVPYNLFLHASSAAAKYSTDGSDDDVGKESASTRSAVMHSFFDTVVSISIGGIITAALMISAAVTFSADGALESAADIATQLRPLLGDWADRGFAIGLFAAGLTSSITAPIAAAYATAGCMGWPAKLSDPRLKATAIAVIFVGTLMALIFKNNSPQEVIIVAQAANGILLPIIAVFLLYTMNRADLLGDYKNGWISNLCGAAVVLVSSALAIRQLISVWSKLQDIFSNSL